MTSSKVKRFSKLFPTDPVSATAGAVSSWFSLAHPLSVVTGTGFSNIHDVMNPSSPLTQSTDARRPPRATSNNGLPIITSTTGFMTCPIIAARVAESAWGFWAWLKQSTTADAIQPFRTSIGSNANRTQMFFRLSGTGLRLEAWATETTSRLLDATGLTAGAWQFITVEFNGARSGDARAIITVNGATAALSYGTGTGVSEMPATLRTVSGNGSMFALGSGGPFFVGSWGPNFGFFSSAMSGASVGLLTTAARLALMNYQRPT